MRFASTLLVLAACVDLAAWPAAAHDVRIQVGDLSTPEAVRAFDHRLEDAAQRFCGARYAIGDLDGRAGCVSAVRDEALAQLTPAQREAYAQARRPGTTWAAR
jgi:UrcA family protein